MQRSHTDRRAFELHLTPAGRALVAKINQMIPELDATLAAGLTVAEQKQLRLLLRQLADGVGLTPAVHPHLAGRPR